MTLVSKEFTMNNFKKCTCLALSLAILLVLAAHIAAQSFTLEQAMSSPFPSELIVSRRGDKLAWAFDEQGKRNIWLAEGAPLISRALTHYASDDGQELSDLVFAPNGNAIAFVRGQGKNQAGEYPNPSSDAAGAKQEVLVVDVRSGRVTKIGEGNSPMFMAAGDEIIWIRDGHFWISAISGGKERKLFEMRGNVSGAQWSPDGSQLAFVSSRGDHSFISVYEPRTNRLRFLSPSVDRDIAPRWSADGRRIAFIRLFNINDTYSKDRDRLQPWAIWIADAQSGEGHQIWRSGELDDDTFPGLPDDAFWQWVAGDRLMFPSEKDGWAHLYCISVDGGTVTALTPGEFEVDSVALSPDKSFVAFSTNKNDIERRHLWRVNVNDGAPRQITRGGRVEMHP